MSCNSERRPVMKAFCMERKKIFIYLVRCKSWYCGSCGHRNKLEWIAKIAEGIDHYIQNGIEDWMFCTVTSHPKLNTRSQCLYVEPKAWDKLRNRIKYYHGKVRYVYMPELHKNGRVHWHFLMSGGIPVSWWKKHAPSCGFGYMFDSQEILDGRNSVLYVTKELGKSLDIVKWPRKLRRIRTNQKWPKLESGEDFEELELHWSFYCQASYEELEKIRFDMEAGTGMETVILGIEN